MATCRARSCFGILSHCYHYNDQCDRNSSEFHIAEHHDVRDYSSNDIATTDRNGSGKLSTHGFANRQRKSLDENQRRP